MGVHLNTMSDARISLCVITGNEEPTIERFLDSFAGAFDELCIVRAIGAAPHDRTLSLAKDWCRKRGKSFKAGVYDNHGTDGTNRTDGAAVDDSDPRTWPHVDDFAAARNVAWSMATCPWQMWADVDDLLVPADGPLTNATQSGGAELIRFVAKLGRHDRAFFTYDLRHQNESCLRERLFRTGIASWTQPVHETCRIEGEESTPPRTLAEKRVIFEHAPLAVKERDPARNRRIMAWHLRHVNAFAYELMREHFYEWQAGRAALAGDQRQETRDQRRAEIKEARAAALRWGDIANQAEIPAAQRFDLILKQAEIAACDGDATRALELCWAAIRVDPKNRNGWFELARYELKAGRNGRAAMATEFMQSMPKQQANGFPVSGRAFGYEGAQLRAVSLRAAGDEAAARKHEETVFAANGRRISLLHATRGRPEQAVATRDLWHKAAFCPLGVEHIFAIDADDAESMEKLKYYRHVVVTEPRGCVKAWNAAAAESSGHVLVQLSDDWIPCHDWDALIFEALAAAASKRTKDLKPEEVGSVPLVLAVHDGHRTDALLCMAICTRARYLGQVDPVVEIVDATDEPMETVESETAPYLFAPEYFGVFSDNEFTHRAYDDGVVVQAQHIVFQHQHPVFAGKPVEEWDETHRRQNAPERYVEGLEIFNRRNPKHAIEIGRKEAQAAQKT